MGGAVSSGRDNDELIDNLKAGNFIRTRDVELAFRAVDRGDYLLPDVRHQAYKDLAWRSGPLHMSAPCIYSEVMESLELAANLSFLNVGSGTGYLSTMAGLILGSGGINHGVEIHPVVVDYANKKLKDFLEQSHALNEFDFSEPKFFVGNGLCLAPLQAAYDRVYCGAGCPDEYQNYFKQLIKVGGILVMPLNNNLVQMRRTSVTEWSSRNVLSVQFATLRVPQEAEARDFRLEELSPPRLVALARGAVRACVRGHIVTSHPALAPPTSCADPPRPHYPRRICIPIDDESDVEELNALHDLDREGGANEMNALLNLVLSMGSNHVAGAIRFDTLDSGSDTSDADTDHERDELDERVERDELDERVERDELDERDERDELDERVERDELDERVERDDDVRGADENAQENDPNDNGLPNGNEYVEEMEAEASHSNAEVIESDEVIYEPINNWAEEDTKAVNSNKPSHNQNETTNNHSHLNGNRSPKAGGSRSNVESEHVDLPNDESNSQSNQSTSQSHLSNLRESMSELCDRTIYRALTGHDRPANSNESDQGTRGKLSVTLEYNDPADMVNLDSSSTEEGGCCSTNSNKKRRNRKRHSQSSLNRVDADESDSAKTDTAQEKSSDLSEDEEVPETSTSKGKGKAKRQKFDSGIGDGDSPSTSSPSSKDYTKDLDAEISLPLYDEDNKSRDEHDDGSTSDSSSSSSSPLGMLRRPPASSPRRAQLSALTVSAIRALPLPTALKLYLNMDRPFTDTE